MKQEKQRVSLSISSFVYSFNKYLPSVPGTKLGVGWSLRWIQGPALEELDSHRTDRQPGTVCAL